MTDPFDVDFAALRALRLVQAHGSFSRAAESLGVTQSTVSYTVARLRQVFGDPLFVRQGGGIVATGRCIEIVDQIGTLLDRFEALTAPREFDPGTARVEVAIACNFYERVTVIPELAHVLRARAPGIKLNVISSTVRGKAQLQRGESDILIGPIEIGGAGFFRRALMRDHYVCILDPDNPLAQGGLDKAAYARAPQVLVTYGGNFRSRFLLEMEREGMAPNAVMEVPSPASLPELIVGTDMLATVPRRTALSFGAAVREVACPFRGEFGIDLYWTPRTHVSAAHVWVRRELAAAAARIAARSG